MTNEESRFLERLMLVFKQETIDHLQSIAALLLACEKPGFEQVPAKTIEHLQLELHSMKGAARSVDRRDVEMLCQDAELLLIRVRKDDAVLSAKAVAALRELIGYLDCAVVHEEQQDFASRMLPLQTMLRAL